MNLSVVFRSTICLLTVLAVLTVPSRLLAVAFDWVTVGNPGNVADTVVMLTDGTTGYGRVDYVYQIAKYEVTNVQYVSFLNSVAAADPKGLFDPEMDSSSFGGITRIGMAGSYSYSVKSGRANYPVNFVEYEDACRFTNWVNNGQPSGAQSPSTTEDGAYDMSSFPRRKSGAQVFIPNDDEWYKAAYYKGGGTNAGYWKYPVQSDFPPSSDNPPGSEFSANLFTFLYPERGLTNIGSYPLALSAYGTLDQAGNIWERTELKSITDVLWGAAFNSPPSDSASNFRYLGSARQNAGFRLASIPEPSSLLLLGLGFGMIVLKPPATGR